MISLTGLLSASIAAALTIIPQDGFAPVRVDCDVSATRHHGPEFKLTEPWGAIAYTFLFPYEAKAGGEAYYVMTTDDGRSWLRRITIAKLEGGKWPSFNAVLGGAPDELRITSDPSVSGRVGFTAFPRMLTDGGGSVEERGTCRITSQAEKAKAQ